MQKADVLIIGAGPAALSALAGLADSSSLRVVQLTGASAPKFGRDAWLDGGLKQPAAAGLLGLPEVRAFGVGGTTQLWHGGLYMPNAFDEIRSDADGIRDGRGLLPHLGAVLERSTHQAGPLFKAVREVLTRCEAAQDSRAAPVRNIYIPRVRPQIDAATQHAAARGLGAYTLCGDTVVDIVAGSGGVQVLCAHDEGFRVIEAGHVVLAAGVLGSGILLRRLLGLPLLRFSDHYHVFAGVVPTEVAGRLTAGGIKAPGFHQHVKFSVDTSEGGGADVSFSFRRVSNPDFPRSGRRFGKFIGVNALSKAEKVALLLRNPMTGVEMLAYRWGVQLPLPSCIVHVTVSPHGRAGVISAAGVDPAIPRDVINAAIGKAWDRLRELAGNDRDRLRLFPDEQITDSVISGAQFVGSLSDVLPAHPLAQYITIADCSRFQFTSVYNQGLVSLAAGYAAVAGKF